MSEKLILQKSIKPIEYRSLGEITAEKLRKAIIRGELPSGERITEMDISENMGISRVVVREAIQMLISEGLLTKERNKYTMIVNLTEKDIEDIFELRIALEQTAAKRCINKTFVMKELVNLVKELQLYVERGQEDSIILMEKDILIHRCLVHRSMNIRLIKAWDEIYGPMMLLLHRYIRSEQKVILSHQEIIYAMETGDKDALMEKIEAHIEDTKQRLLENCNKIV